MLCRAQQEEHMPAVLADGIRRREGKAKLPFREAFCQQVPKLERILLDPRHGERAGQRAEQNLVFFEQGLHFLHIEAGQAAFHALVEKGRQESKHRLRLYVFRDEGKGLRHIGGDSLDYLLGRTVQKLPALGFDIREHETSQRGLPQKAGKLDGTSVTVRKKGSDTAVRSYAGRKKGAGRQECHKKRQHEAAPFLEHGVKHDHLRQSPDREALRD